jgi:hypothetical protein
VSQLLFKNVLKSFTWASEVSQSISDSSTEELPFKMHLVIWDFETVHSFFLFEKMFVLSLTRISEKLENAWMKDDGF